MTILVYRFLKHWLRESHVFWTRPIGNLSPMDLFSFRYYQNVTNYTTPFLDISRLFLDYSAR